jgi:hypothetical protein
MELYHKRDYWTAATFFGKDVIPSHILPIVQEPLSTKHITRLYEMRSNPITCVIVSITSNAYAFLPSTVLLRFKMFSQEGNLCVQRHAPAALYPVGKDPRYPMYRRLGGPQSRSGQRLQEKSFRLCRGSNPVRPVCSQTLHWLSYPSSVQLFTKSFRFWI